MPRRLLFIGVICVFQQLAPGQTTQPADDAATLYLRAAALIRDNDARNIMSPASSNDEYPEYPPYPAKWHQMEKADFAANVEARALAHQARSIDQANWPSLRLPHQNISYLNECRNLSNELADAALYEHFQGNDAAAIETLRDQWRLSDQVENQKDKKLVLLLVGIGIRAEMCDRLEIITSNVILTRDAADTNDLQTSVARDLIGPLIEQQDATTVVNEVLKAYGTEANNITKASIDRCIESTRRVNAERYMAAMSLACHLYRFDTGGWPKSLDDLHGYLPTVPIDPWGDGKQTMGYVLIKGGLPDGSDRPLVYSRSGLKDGLFFRTDGPQYGFYVDDGSKRPQTEQKHGGQFRDVASWSPPGGNHPSAPRQLQ